MKPLCHVGSSVTIFLTPVARSVLNAGEYLRTDVDWCLRVYILSPSAPMAAAAPMSMEPSSEEVRSWTCNMDIMTWVRMQATLREQLKEQLAVEDDDPIRVVAALSPEDVEKAIASMVRADGTLGLPAAHRAKVELWWQAAQIACGVRWTSKEVAAHEAGMKAEAETKAALAKAEEIAKLAQYRADEARRDDAARAEREAERERAIRLAIAQQPPAPPRLRRTTRASA